MTLLGIHNYSIIQGERFSDYRGTIISSNDLDMSQINRQYIIEHRDSNIVRAWQGHKYESKWMRCLVGSFVINLIKPLNIEKPTGGEKVDLFHLVASENQILYIPGGYFTGIKCHSVDSLLQIFSNVRFPNAALDDFRLNQDFWKFKQQED